MTVTIVPSPPAGTAYVYTALADCINASWSNASDMQDTYSAKVINASGSWLDPTSNPQHISMTAVTPASVTEPVATATVTDALALYGTQYAALITLLEGKFLTFQNTWFPTDATVYAAAESWLQDALNNPSQVLPSALADIIWEEDRSRILADSQRAADAAVASWAAKRYPMPPGAAVSAAVQIQQTNQDKLAESSRKVAIRTFELAYDKVRFAVEKAISSRQIAMVAALEYIKAMATAPDMGGRIVGMGYNAEATLRTAAAHYFGARTEATKLAYAGAEYNARASQSAAEKNQSADLTMIEDKLKALLAEASGIAQLATAWANNLHAQTSAQGSDSVQTNY